MLHLRELQVFAVLLVVRETGGCGETGSLLRPFPSEVMPEQLQAVKVT